MPPELFSKCPKCGQLLTETGRGIADACPSCGLVFRKYLQTLAGAPLRVPAKPIETEAEEAPDTRWFLYVPEEVEPWRVYTGAALFVVSLFFGWRFYLMDIPDWEMAGTFLHGAMVPFHEVGHLLFSPFGEFMMLAGGSLAQFLIPLGFLGYFSLKNRDHYTASLMLWWAGTQFVDLAPYAWDAREPQHVLLSGRTGDTGAHDYIDMLGMLGLLNSAHQVAWLMHKTGLVVMIVAWVWGACILWRRYQRISPR